MGFTRRSFLSGASAACACAAVKRVEAAATRGNHEYHVSPSGSDQNDGSPSRTLATISAAAANANPGDVITVHKGVYRERIDPPRGGHSDNQRIVYQAAPGDTVEIVGSEPVTGWSKVQGDVWRIVVPNTLFGNFNPYSDLIRGDWFDPKHREHHTGADYLNGEWLAEAAQQDDLFKAGEGEPLWFAKVDDKETTLWAQFNGTDPNKQLTEINVRQSVFYPSKTGINFVTVRGFILRQAATPWATPTAEQIGLIGTHWSKGWIIEDNVISHSTCSGIALGKYGDQWDNQSHDSATGYVDTIDRAVKSGWSKENVGSHLVRGNTISHCEQAGIVGSLGAIFSTITGNTVHDVHVRRLFTGAEMAGIKLHAAIDVEISHNIVYRSGLALWLDWMAQGTHVTKNLFFENDGHDLFVEVDHGPILVDNNIFLSKVSQRSVSQGIAYVHNLFCGGTELVSFDARMTPFMKAHSTNIAGLHNNPSGDIRFYNNLFTQGADITPFNQTMLPMTLAGNVFVDGAKACSHEADPFVDHGFDTAIHLGETKEGCQLEITLDRSWAAEQTRTLVGSGLLGQAAIPNLRFERADGSPIRIDTDYSGRVRNPDNPFPGPFECPAGGRQLIAMTMFPAGIDRRFDPSNLQAILNIGVAWN